MRLSLSAGALLSLYLGFALTLLETQGVVNGSSEASQERRRLVPAHETASSSKAVALFGQGKEDVALRGTLRRHRKRGHTTLQIRGGVEEAVSLPSLEKLASSKVNFPQLVVEGGSEESRRAEEEYRQQASLEAVMSVHDDCTLPQVPPLIVPSSMSPSQRRNFRSLKMHHIALSTYDVVVPSINDRDDEFALLDPSNSPVRPISDDDENEEKEEKHHETIRSGDDSIIRMARQLLLLDPETASEYYELENEGYRIQSSRSRDRHTGDTEQGVIRIPYMTLTMTATPEAWTRSAGIVDLHNFTPSTSHPYSSESEAGGGLDRTAEPTVEDVDASERYAPPAVEEDGLRKGGQELHSSLSDSSERGGDTHTAVSANVVDYANKNSGAVVLEKSAAFQGTSNLILNDVDRYALVPCDKEQKYVVIGLSEDILVKEVRLSSFERYSSHVRKFQVLGSQSFPVLPRQDWADLGTYEAAAPSATGSREQTFELKEPSWARYIKFRLLSHYGVEDYCTLTQIKVHGWTMLQGFHEQWKESKSEAEKEVLSMSTAVPASDNAPLSAPPGSKVESEAEYPSKLVHAGQTVFHGHSCGRSGVCHDGPLRAQVHTTSDALDNLRSSSGYLAATGETQCGSKEVSSKAPTSGILSSASFRPLAGEKSSRPASNDPDNSGGLDHSASSSSSDDAYAGSYSDTVRMAVSDASEAIRTITESSSVGHAVRELHKMIMEKVNASFVLPLLTANTSVEESPETTEAPLDAALGSEFTFETTKERQFYLADEFEGEQGNPTPLIGGVENSALDEPHDDVIMSVEALKFIKRKLPNSGCLESLSIEEFRTKLRRGGSRATGSPGPGTPSSGTGSHSSGIMEPIFKTLTDELKLMQIQQSLYDQYLLSLSTCYSRVVVDMATEMEAMEKSNEERLSAMEEAIRQLQTNQKSSLIAPQGLVEMASLAGKLWNSFANLIVWHLKEVLVDSPHFLALVVSFWVLRWLMKLVWAVFSWFGKRNREKKAPVAHRRRRRTRKQGGSAPSVNLGESQDEESEASVRDDEDKEEKTMRFSNQRRDHSDPKPNKVGTTNGLNLSTEYNTEEHQSQDYNFPPGSTLEDDLSYSDDSGDKPPLSRVIVPGGLER